MQAEDSIALDGQLFFSLVAHDSFSLSDIKAAESRTAASRPKPTLGHWPESGSNAPFTCRSAADSGQWPLSAAA